MEQRVGDLGSLTTAMSSGGAGKTPLGCKPHEGQQRLVICRNVTFLVAMTLSQKYEVKSLFNPKRS